MIPVCSHRYLPAGRGTYGHPVLSIYQTDIIIYGTDLADYINQEPGRHSSAQTGRRRRWCRSGATSSERENHVQWGVSRPVGRVLIRRIPDLGSTPRMFGPHQAGTFDEDISLLVRQPHRGTFHREQIADYFR
jgi:hypothetical protein